MLDVLITVSDDTPKAWVTDCRDSVQHAASRAKYPVNVIEVPGIPGHIGRAMAAGFAKTTAPYVAWVDDDDYVLGEAFLCLKPYFAAAPDALCTRELWLTAAGRLLRAGEDRRHHLTAYRRDNIHVPTLLADPARPNARLIERLKRVKDIPAHVYVWRRYRSKGSALRGQVSPA